jgi:hypothetical protein
MLELSRLRTVIQGASADGRQQCEICVRIGNIGEERRGDREIVDAFHKVNALSRDRGGSW